MIDTELSLNASYDHNGVGLEDSLSAPCALKIWNGNQDKRWPPGISDPCCMSREGVVHSSRVCSPTPTPGKGSNPFCPPKRCWEICVFWYVSYMVVKDCYAQICDIHHMLVTSSCIDIDGPMVGYIVCVASTVSVFERILVLALRIVRVNSTHSRMVQWVVRWKNSHRKVINRLTTKRIVRNSNNDRPWWIVMGHHKPNVTMNL